MIKRISTRFPSVLSSRSGKGTSGFSLVELLTVLAVTGMLAYLTVPAMQGLQRAGSFSHALEATADTLRYAHFYALANNTYVYCGITEVDVTQSAMTSPQAYTGNGGRVAISLVATKDGTSDASAWDASGKNLTQLRSIQILDFFHVASTAFPTTTTGAMARSSNVVTTPVLLPASGSPLTSFPFPLASSTARFNFNNNNSVVIGFNPQGAAFLNGTACQWLELDVQPMSGTAAPAAPSNVNKGQLAALVMDGVSGAVTVYRP